MNMFNHQGRLTTACTRTAGASPSPNGFRRLKWVISSSDVGSDFAPPPVKRIVETVEKYKNEQNEAVGGQYNYFEHALVENPKSGFSTVSLTGIRMFSLYL